MDSIEMVQNETDKSYSQSITYFTVLFGITYNTVAFKKYAG